MKWSFLIRGPLAWKHQYQLREGLKENNSGLSSGLPCYNRTGWLGVRHQVTYLIWVVVFQGSHSTGILWQNMLPRFFWWDAMGMTDVQNPITDFIITGQQVRASWHAQCTRYPLYLQGGSTNSTRILLFACIVAYLFEVLWHSVLSKTVFPI